MFANQELRLTSMEAPGTLRPQSKIDMMQLEKKIQTGVLELKNEQSLPTRNTFIVGSRVVMYGLFVWVRGHSNSIFLANRHVYI